jgi:hypothetical protein
VAGRFLLLAAFAGAALAGPKDKKEAAPYALIFGTVFQESGFSLPGAHVEIVPVRELQGARKFKRLEAVSDARGEFAFRVPVDEMTYKLSVKADGYLPQEKSVDAAGEVRVDVFFRLEATKKRSESK